MNASGVEASCSAAIIISEIILEGFLLLFLNWDYCIMKLLNILCGSCVSVACDL